MSKWDERKLNRREALKAAGAAALCWGALGAAPAVADAQEKKSKKRILMYTRSQTFEHSTVKRKDDQLGFAEKLLVDLGKKHGFDVDATKDGRLFTEETFAKYDAFFFYTTGDSTQPGGDNQPPMPPQGKQLLLDAVASGKGFIGSHCASDTFHSSGKAFEMQEEDKRDPFIRMLGGEFIRHGEQQEATLRAVSKKFPGCAELGDGLRVKEEWYTLKNFAPDIHVILVQETSGMRNPDYQRPPYPATWARKHKKGRVFYTSLGHREDVWENEKFQKLLLGGISFALGEAEADLTPNIQAVTPEASTMPPEK
jgi:hypothetical protein